MRLGGTNMPHMRRSPLNSGSPASTLQSSLGSPASTLRIPSPGSMPGASNSMPCFTSTSTSCMSSPPNVVIDEATNDVPPPMMRPFIPKVEDTCTTDSGMYAMRRMMDINDDTVSSLLEERAATMMANAGPTLMGEMATEDNKFPAGFMSSMKSDMPEMNWMMNQSAPTYSNSAAAAASSVASEPSLENWLGQIFKSDNLTAGCSLPQSQQQMPVENVNYV